MIEGTPIESMEIAKQIIGAKIKVDPAALASIAANKEFRKGTRIAAVYALGLIGEPTHAGSLKQIVSDQADDIDVREHAAEALGNIHDPTSLDLLREVLAAEKNLALRASCEFAIRELAKS
jgi:HEAT repeat protein